MAALKVFSNNDHQLFIITIDSNSRGTCSRDYKYTMCRNYALCDRMLLIHLLKLNYDTD